MGSGTRQNDRRPSHGCAHLFHYLVAQSCRREHMSARAKTQSDKARLLLALEKT